MQYNVLSFGAVGDGIYDDTAAIQAAIDAIPMSNRVPTILLVRMDEYQERVIVNKDNVRIIGEARDRTVITHSGCDEETISSVYEYVKSLGLFNEIHITRAGGVISSHCGPGTLGVLFIEE